MRAVDLTVTVPSADLALQVDELCISEMRPVNWRQPIEHCFQTSAEHSSFAVQILDLICQSEDQGDEFVQNSFIELSIGMTHFKGLPTLSDGGSGRHCLTVRQTLRKAFQFLGMAQCLQSAISRPEAGIMTTTDGSIFFMAVQFWPLNVLS